jgi:hypothetical protein
VNETLRHFFGRLRQLAPQWPVGSADRQERASAEEAAYVRQVVDTCIVIVLLRNGVERSDPRSYEFAKAMRDLARNESAFTPNIWAGRDRHGDLTTARGVYQFNDGAVRRATSQDEDAMTWPVAEHFQEQSVMQVLAPIAYYGSILLRHSARTRGWQGDTLGYEGLIVMWHSGPGYFHAFKTPGQYRAWQQRAQDPALSESERMSSARRLNKYSQRLSEAKARDLDYREEP